MTYISRKRRHVNYSSYVNKAKQAPSLEALFLNITDEECGHGCPPLPCPYIQPNYSSEELLLTTIVCVSRFLSLQLRPFCLRGIVGISRVAAFISDVCHVFCLMHSLLWNDRQADGHKIVLNSIVDPEMLYNEEVFQDIAKFRFISLQVMHFFSLILDFISDMKK